MASLDLRTPLVQEAIGEARLWGSSTPLPPSVLPKSTCTCGPSLGKLLVLCLALRTMKQELAGTHVLSEAWRTHHREILAGLFLNPCPQIWS